MKTKNKIKKVPKGFTRNPDLELFKDKVEKANQILKTVGLPKE